MNKSSKVLLTTIGGVFVAITIVMVGFRYVTANSIDYTDSSKLAEWETSVVGNNLFANTMQLPTFSSISVNGHFDLALQQGGKNQISVATNKQEFPDIRVTLKQKNLALNQKQSLLMPPGTAAVMAKTIKSINLNGQTTLYAKNIQTDTLTVNMDGDSTGYLQGDIKNIKVNLNGETELHIDAAKENTLYVQINGNGKLFLSGATEALSVISDGNAIVDATKLVANDVSINAAGNSNVVVNAQDKLTVNTVGSCVVKYYGDPAVKKNVVGESTVAQVTTGTPSAK